MAVHPNEVHTLPDAPTPSVRTGRRFEITHHANGFTATIHSREQWAIGRIVRTALTWILVIWAYGYFIGPLLAWPAADFPYPITALYFEGFKAVGSLLAFIIIVPFGILWFPYRDTFLDFQRYFLRIGFRLWRFEMSYKIPLRKIASIEAHSFAYRKNRTALGGIVIEMMGGSRRPYRALGKGMLYDDACLLIREIRRNYRKTFDRKLPRFSL